MSGAKSAKYSSKEQVDEIEELTDRLAQDLKRNIKQLESFPILSDPWFDVADIFGRIASISDVESRLSAGKEEAATLWETEEQALRFLLEDGKLNLCLKCLVEFKTTQISQRKAGEGPMLVFLEECDKFEKGLGSILRNAWSHVEVLQTTDLAALVNYIADVLLYMSESPEVVENFVRSGDIHQRQEVVIFYYLADLFKRIEDVGESRIMPLVRERRLFMLGVHVLTHLCSIKGEKQLQKPHRLKAAEALALLCQTEDFGTYRAQHYSNGVDVEKMSELKDLGLADLMTNFDDKKVIRPLVDAIEKAKRLARSK